MAKKAPSPKGANEETRQQQNQNRVAVPLSRSGREGGGRAGEGSGEGVPYDSCRGLITQSPLPVWTWIVVRPSPRRAPITFFPEELWRSEASW